MTLQQESTPHEPKRAAARDTLHVSVRRALCTQRATTSAAILAIGLVAVTPPAQSAQFPPVFPLASLYPAGGGDGTRGFVLTGIEGGDEAGYALGGAGDVNGDGVDDVIVGSWKADAGGELYASESYVVFGRSAAR